MGSAGCFDGGHYARSSVRNGLRASSVGRVDLPFGDWDTLLDSIRLLLDRFPPGTPVYPGHGPPTTLGQERATNPFLRELAAR